MPAPDPIAFAGTQRFEVRRRLGAGAMGVVYEAFDRERAIPVALKVMRSAAPASLMRFKHELRALAGISHPNLVALHELHNDGATWFIAMELLDACVDLRTYVREDEHRLRASMAQLAQGLAALHAAERLHRDIKPSNVLVTREPRVVLSDFGLISREGADRLGTPAYAAPEQASGDATTASDWYAVGVVLYELLTGALPFQGSGKAIMFDKARYDAQPVLVRRPDAPADLAALCDALLRREPAARPTAGDVLRRLDVAHRAVVQPKRDQSMFVGRDDALLVLREAFAEAERGSGNVVYVRGTSGIGKTTLLASFVSDLDAIVLAGRCYQQESVPYKALDSLVDALARHLGTLSPAEVDAVLPRDIVLLAQVFPVLAGVEAVARAKRRRGVPAELHELRRRAFVALRELIARLAEQRPVVMVIDDLQWGDVDSAPILDGLMLPPDPPAMLLVLAYRAEDEDRAALLRALRHGRQRLAATRAPIELTLEPLGLDDARRLATTLSVDPSRAEAIAAESGGVPFLLHELAMTRMSMPSMDGAIECRLDDLSRGERVLIELVAHAAKPVARDVLAAASQSTGEQRERDLARLVADRLMRVTPDGEFECYHDRIREAVCAALSEPRRRDLHARLAQALAAELDIDLEALVVHFEGAGDRVRAGEHALAAADQASRALAFDRAAHLYRTALRLSELDTARTRSIRTLLGDALANAGQGDAAAETYLVAAQGAPAAEATELRRRAASQYLRTGQIESGLRVLDEVLAEVGGSRPQSPRRAFASLAWHRLRLRLRGLGFEPRDSTRVAPYELARLDVLWTAATSLGMVDLVVGADFATRQVLVSLALGERTRVARALTAEAMFLAAQGDRTRERTQAVLARAAVLIGELDDPELAAWLAAARGLAEYQLGHFRRASELAEEGGRRLRDDCTARLWESGSVEALSMWSLFYLGELRELSVRVDAAVEQARLRGNRFDAANFGTGLPALAWAVADRTEQGRVQVDRALAEWSPRGFHLQHYYGLLAHASFDLYDGAGEAAHARVEAMWPLLEQSRLLICQSVAIEAHHLRARSALAAGKDITRHLRVLGRYRTPWSAAVIALLRAGAATECDEAARLLTAAIDACVAADMTAFASAARRRRGELLCDLPLIDRADRDLAAQAVRAPNRLARLLVPLRSSR
ncbi:MAG: protein kinase [Deltaproteobacteria bacterium]|nr:protein kinase [Deltaproteobacteria bacterium]